MENKILNVRTIYLETSVFNYPFADDDPRYRDDTLRLFDFIRIGMFEAYTSDYVVDELEDTGDAVKRNNMIALIDDYCVTRLPKSYAKDAKQLAALYISAGVIPQKHDTDALHIAMATVAGLDCIVSLNFKHIVKQETIFEAGNINASHGYKRVSIHSPTEVINYANKS